MDTITHSRLRTAILVVAATLLPLGTAAAQGTMMGNGTMSNHWYGSGGVWLPVLAIVVVGAVVFAVLRRRQ